MRQSNTGLFHSSELLPICSPPLAKLAGVQRYSEKAHCLERGP